MLKKIQKNGFTLIETLLAAIVLGIISTGSILAVTSLVQSGEMARNRNMATNLLQKSQEEVKRAAQTFFDTIEDCQFPNAPGDPNPCGFDNMAVSYPEFTRNLSVEKENGSTELKRALITLSWKEAGSIRQNQSLVLLARPPQALPGNIIGFAASDEDPNVPLEGVKITIGTATSVQLIATISSDTINPVKLSNFDFSDPDTGKYLLKAGSYDLSAFKEGFLPYTYPNNPVAVNSNDETFVKILLTPQPEDARIYGSVINQNTGIVVNDFFESEVNLYQNGSSFTDKVETPDYSFAIPFTDTTSTECFTVNTTDVFKAGYAGFPSCVFTYDREGWSSATTRSGNTLDCNNPRNGNNTSDRICVSSGDEHLLEIPVIPVPEVIVTGRVIDNKGNPVPNATVQARWPNSDRSPWRTNGAEPTALTNNNGEFTYEVPAVQGLFPDTNPNLNYLKLRANGRFSIQHCCGWTPNVTLYSPWTTINSPLFPGSGPVDVGDLIITVEDTRCGNAQGTVRDGKSGSGLGSTNVRIYNVQEPTNGAGDYIFDCPSTGFRLPVGSSRIRSFNNAYYNFDSNGNQWYQPQPSIVIQDNSVSTYDIRTWPEGRGTIQVTVIDEQSLNPITDVSVRLTPYFGSAVTQVTNNSGEVLFNNVIETWPALGVTDPSYYKLNPHNHQISVTPDLNIYSAKSVTVTNFHNGDNLLITVSLKRQGGV